MTVMVAVLGLSGSGWGAAWGDDGWGCWLAWPGLEDRGRGWGRLVEEVVGDCRDGRGCLFRPGFEYEDGNEVGANLLQGQVNAGDGDDLGDERCAAVRDLGRAWHG